MKPMAEKQKTLVFYSLSTCANCKKAVEYLSSRGYEHSTVHVDKLPVEEKTRLRDSLTAKYGQRVTFPALEIQGERVVLGFFPAAWDAALAGGESHG